MVWRNDQQIRTHQMVVDRGIRQFFGVENFHRANRPTAAGGSLRRRRRAEQQSYRKNHVFHHHTPLRAPGPARSVRTLPLFSTILRPQRSEGARNDAARDDLRLAEPAYSGLWQRAKRQTQKILSRVSKHFKAGFEE